MPRDERLARAAVVAYCANDKPPSVAIYLALLYLLALTPTGVLAQPTFFLADERWDVFLGEQRAHHPNLGADLAMVVSALDAFWIVRAGEDYEYALQLEHTADGETRLS
jgi:hypothetical protein